MASHVNSKKNPYLRLYVLAIEVMKVDERIVDYKTSEDAETIGSQLMINQYEQLRREFYVDFLQELLSLPTHPKEFLSTITQLTERIFTDIDADNRGIIEMKKSLDLVLKAS